MYDGWCRTWIFVRSSCHQYEGTELSHQLRCKDNTKKTKLTRKLWEKIMFFSKIIHNIPTSFAFLPWCISRLPETKGKAVQRCASQGFCRQYGRGWEEMWQKGRQTWIRTAAYSRIWAKKQGSVQFSRLAFRMDFKGGENPFLMAREGHRKPPRHPSVRNIAKSGKGHFTGFSGRKSENIGPLWAKVRMFVPKSTDVLPWEVRCFWSQNGPISSFFHQKHAYFKGNRIYLSHFPKIKIPQIDITTLQNTEKQPNFHSGRVAKDCQNFWRFWHRKEAFWMHVLWAFLG